VVHFNLFCLLCQAINKIKFLYNYICGVAGCWLLVAGCWLLVAGCWLLVAGCWLLVAGCW
jgi:hypothetical protein